MPVRYLLINGNDTASLHFRSPDIRSDSSGYNITKSMIDNFRLIITDTVISDYLEDIESYTDNSKKPIHATDNRMVNTLRKKEYSR